MTDREYLLGYVQKHGPIRCVKVSSAKACNVRPGFSVPYWGVAYYDVDMAKAKDRLVLRCVSGAGRDRRARHLCEQDARDTGYPVILDCGALSDRDAQRVRRWTEHDALLSRVQKLRAELAQAEEALQAFDKSQVA